MTNTCCFNFHMVETDFLPSIACRHEMRRSSDTSLVHKANTQTLGGVPYEGHEGVTM